MLKLDITRAFSNRFLLILAFIALLAPGNYLLAQKPQVTSLDKKNKEPDAVLTINGTNFGSDKNNIVVMFGAAMGEIVSINNTRLEVKVPPGATFNQVSITNLTSGLTGYSPESFYPSFSGASINSWSAQYNAADEGGLMDICTCDFNGDGKNDMITASRTNGFITVWTNTSTATDISFTKFTINLFNPTLHIACGDLDGDGKPDVVFSRQSDVSGDRIYVLRNTSESGVISFDNDQQFLTGGFGPRVVVIKDLDNDGKPEVIVSHRGTKFFIFVNTSTIGTINFAADKIELEMPTLSTNGLAIDDLNGDGLADIVVSPENDKDVYIFQNTSTTGQISFRAPKRFNVVGSLAMIKIGDLDNDGKPEIAVTKIISSDSVDNISILRNITPSIGGDINFATALDLKANPKATGIDFGDLDGDGLLDIVIGSIETNANPPFGNKLSILKNNSTPGNLSFTLQKISTTQNNRMVKIADMNGDGKPDICFTTPHNNNISVIRNRNCFSPRIAPPSTTVLCDGSTITLQATNSPGVSFVWTRHDVPLPETSSTLVVTQGGSYKVQAITEGGACNRTSAAIVITGASGETPQPATASNSGPVCTGETLKLTASTVAGATYKWTGPNNFTSNQQNPEIRNVTAQMAGTYTLEVAVGSCSSEQVTTDVTVNIIESQTIQAQGPTTVCEGKDVILGVATVAGYSYQWKRNGVNVQNATSSSFQANSTGNYSIVLMKDDCEVESSALRVNVLPPPTVSFTAPATICKNKVFQLYNTSQTAEGVTPIYHWDFGNGHTATSKDASHQYAEPGNYVVKLTVHYGDEDCKAEFSRNIEIVNDLTLEIQSDKGLRPCMGETVTLSVPGNYATYSWNTGANTPYIEVKEPGIYSVNITTPEGCFGTGSIELDFLLTPIVDITVEDDYTSISRGESVQLWATGALTYQWFPADGLNDPNIENPIATPMSTTTYKVIGTAVNGCSTEKEVTINVSNTINVTPRKIFSPNGDGIDDYWVIDRIHNYPECTVSIFDRQGIKVFERRNYDNTWDGVFNGQNLMKGVYFYVIRCGTNENQKAGSITLIR